MSRIMSFLTKIRAENSLSTIILVVNYYLAALLLVVAGLIKVFEPGVAGILNTLYEREVLQFEALLTISRVQPWLEIFMGLLALSGWRSLWFARILAGMYIFFALLILYVSDGYLTLPIDCGCFGEGEKVPVYLLLLRNGLIATLLLIYRKPARRFFVFG